MCHQTVSLVANHLEAAGIPTVVIGSARDIVEEHGVARFVFTDFPLGNPCGRPWEAAMQRAIVMLALDLHDTAIAPRTTVQAPFRWPGDEWRERYMDPNDTEKLAELGRRRQAAQAKAKAKTQKIGSLQVVAAQSAPMNNRPPTPTIMPSTVNRGSFSFRVPS